jgi:hypothetical protein
LYTSDVAVDATYQALWFVKDIEPSDRARRERRIRAGRLSAMKSFDMLGFAAIPWLDQPLILEFARCEYVVARNNIIAPGNCGSVNMQASRRPASAAITDGKCLGTNSDLSYARRRVLG